MGSIKLRVCSICGTKHRTCTDDYVFVKGIVNFCQDCQQDLERVINPPSEFDQQINALYETLSGWREVVINRSHGGFSLSETARLLYLDTMKMDYVLLERESRDATRSMGKMIKVAGKIWSEDNISRDDPTLVQIVRNLGIKANGQWAELKIVSIPADARWEIESYDGLEWISESHRIWV